MVDGSRWAVRHCGHPWSLGLSKSTLGDGLPLEIGCHCIWVSAYMGLMLELRLDLLMELMLELLMELL